jgi:site-specific DNA recombinase
MKGAVLYTRVSTDEQAKQQHNLPAQEKKLRDYCQQHELKVLRLFTDRGESARTADRPQFQAMLSYCRSHRDKISKLVVADLSRLARNVVDQGTTIATLHQLGISLVSVDEPFSDDSAAGKLARNMLASMNQFFSDSLSERIRYRMKAGLEAGRFLHYAPIGYRNVNKDLSIDSERAPLVRKAFELIGSGTYTTGETVLKLITGMGLRTRRGRALTKQSFARMLANPIYSGWIQNGKDRVRGKHEALVSDDLFQQVQDQLNGKSAPHKKLNEDFPLKQFVRCAKCNRPLTAGWVKGRKERYARYWCWQKGCGAIGVSRDELEADWVRLLAMFHPTQELIEKLPEIAARQWASRKERVGKDAETLSKRLADQNTLNQKLIVAKLNGEISQQDFQTMKTSIADETERINTQISALDAEKSTLQDLMQQAQTQLIDFVTAWRKANVNQRHELARGLFPEALVYSHENKFFEPENKTLKQMTSRLLDDLEAEELGISPIGAGDGI